MADAVTLVKSPDESVKDFNERILTQCMPDDLEEDPDWQPVTQIEATIVHGQPVLTLISGALDEGGSDDGDEEGEGEEVVLAGPPLLCALVKMDAQSHKNAGKSESHFDKIADLAGGDIVEVRHLSGAVQAWRELPTIEDGAPVTYAWVNDTVAYILLIWLAPDIADQGDDDDDVEVKDAEIVPNEDEDDDTAAA